MTYGIIEAASGVINMISMTETAEKRMLLLLKKGARDGLKIVTGPDGRLRLVLDKGCRVESDEKSVSVGCLIADKAKSAVDEIIIRISG